MAAQSGHAMVLSVTNAGASYEVVAGIRSTNITLNAETVDITNADSTNKWRELLDTAGILSATISGSGVFKDAAADVTMKNWFVAGSLKNWKILVPAFGDFAGSFKIASLEYSADYNDAVQFSITLESAGEITFTGA
jgi:TP901-1 family phage major tail protein